MPGLANKHPVTFKHSLFPGIVSLLHNVAAPLPQARAATFGLPSWSPVKLGHHLRKLQAARRCLMNRRRAACQSLTRKTGIQGSNWWLSVELL